MARCGNLNKNPINITYNPLNLPDTLIFEGDNSIVYAYTADGTKLQKTVHDNSSTTTTEYSHGFVYKNGSLKFFAQPEGYVEPNGNGGFTYVYQYKDQLGNIRLSYKNTGSASHHQLSIVEENNYYPFGLKHQGYNNVVNGEEYKYKTYQGQELNDELGLNWLSFKYRNYDPAIGRFMSVDPLATKYPYNGVYNFSENRVVDAVELEGLEARLLNPIYLFGLANDIYQKGKETTKWMRNNIVFGVDLSGSLGVQAGLNTEFGKVEGGMTTVGLGNIGWNSEEQSNSGFYAKESDGKGHNYLGGQVKLFSKKLSIGGKLDYITKDPIPPEGSDLLEYYRNNGKVDFSYNIGPGKGLGRGTKGDYNFLTTGKPTLKAKSDCNCLDIELGAKAIFGVRIDLTIGLKKDGKERKEP